MLVVKIKLIFTYLFEFKFRSSNSLTVGSNKLCYSTLRIIISVEDKHFFSFQFETLYIEIYTGKKTIKQQDVPLSFS